MAGKYERGASEYEERVVALNRVSKTVKGGRVMKFAALVVIGDQKGTIGVGQGKAAEVPDAIRKAIEDAKKNLVTISLKGSSIPHETIGEFGAGRVLLKPAAPGTGHPYQVPALPQPAERCKRNDRRSEEPAHRRAGCCSSRQVC